MFLVRLHAKEKHNFNHIVFPLLLVVVFNDDNDYESNRYPILVSSSNIPLNNYDLQEQYNTNEFPIDEDYQTSFNSDEDDDDGEQYGLFNSNDSPYFVCQKNMFLI